MQLDPSEPPDAPSDGDAATRTDAATAPDGEVPGREEPGDGRWARRLVAVAVAALLLFGLAVRLQGLERSPLHYQSTRQLHTAIIARAAYLDRTLPSSDPRRIAADRTRDHEEPLEAPITEHVLATIYQVIGHESL